MRSEEVGSGTEEQPKKRHRKGFGQKGGNGGRYSSDRKELFLRVWLRRSTGEAPTHMEQNAPGYCNRGHEELFPFLMQSGKGKKQGKEGGREGRRKEKKRKGSFFLIFTTSCLLSTENSPRFHIRARRAFEVPQNPQISHYLLSSGYSLEFSLREN